MTTPYLKMGMREWAMLLILSIVWGGSFFFAKIALAELPPLTLVLYRVALAAMALLGWLLVAGKSIPKGLDIWIAFVVMGLLNNALPFSLLFWGQVRISASLASILNATTPIFTIVVAHFFTRNEKINASRLGGIGLGIAGVVVMLHADFGNNPSGLAMLACLAAALCYGSAAVFGRRFRSKGIAPMQVAFGQLAAATFLMTPLVVLLDPRHQPFELSMLTIFSVLTLALICTACAYILFFRVLATGGAVNISVVTLLVPVSAILLGSLFLAETLMPHHYLGMLLIAAGLLAIDGRIGRVLAHAVRQ